MNVSGTEIPNQRANNANRVVKGMAALLPLAQRIKFSKKNIQKTTLKKKKLLKLFYEQYESNQSWLHFLTMVTELLFKDFLI